MHGYYDTLLFLELASRLNCLRDLARVPFEDKISRSSGCETLGLKLLSAAKEIAFDLRVGRLFAARVQQPCATCLYLSYLFLALMQLCCGFFSVMQLWLQKPAGKCMV